MKLFIPTCTLNFNNIFSTESISPKSFYQRRGFGNKRYYPVEANSLDGVMLMYSKYPRYNVGESDLENYPMVIEIESEDYPSGTITKQYSRSGVDVFASASTIYLNPFHSKVYFNSYAERQGVLTKAAQSLENKFEKLYGANLIVKPQSRKCFTDNIKDLFSKNESDEFDWDSSYLPLEINTDIGDVEQDRKIDRIRGFFYCYLIGANMTISSDVAELKLLARKMRNTLSAIVNSPSRKPSDLQDESLTNDIKEFNRIYTAIDEDALYNSNVIEMKLSNDPSGLNKQDIIKLLERLGVYDAFCSKLHLRRVYNANDLWKCVEFFTPETYNSAVETLNSVVRKVELRSIAKGRKNETKELIQLNKGIVRVVDKTIKAEFYDSLVNSQINNEFETVKDENGVEESLAIAYNGGLILQKILGDKWNDSKWSSYINSLLSHLQESSAFDMFSVENDVLNSFAAFCQKGDNIDRLSEYLIQCGFNNYRIAYGLFGATRGFASLPKTFTTALINGDRNYYKNFVLEVYNQLFGVNISNAELPATANAGEIRESSICSTIMDNIGKIEPKTSKQSQVMNAVNQAFALEDAVQSPKAFMYIFDSFPNIKRTKAYKALESADFEHDTNVYTLDEFRARIYRIIGSEALKAQRQKVDAAIELEAKRQDREAFLYILDNFLNPNDAAYKRIAKLINANPIENASLSTGVRPIEPTSRPILIDDRWIPVCSNMILDSKARKQFIEDMEWFVGNHNDVYEDKRKGKQKGFYAGHDKSSERVIERLRTYMDNKLHPRSEKVQWLADIYKNIPVEKIISYLQSVYVHK